MVSTPLKGFLVTPAVRTDWKQTDVLWSSVPLGGRNCPRDTIGSHGCLLTTLACIIRDHADEIIVRKPSVKAEIPENPKEFTQLCACKGFINADNLLYCGSVGSEFGLRIDNTNFRPEITTEEKAKMIRRSLGNRAEVVGKAQKLFVEDCTHFFRITGISEDGTKVTINDPYNRLDSLETVRVTGIKEIAPVL